MRFYDVNSGYILVSGVPIKEISRNSLRNKFGMTYPAALLTMDWLIKEPEKAIESINRGIR